ncbi:MAG: aminotransferase class V-fold PLP-dependent enzyme, partial [Sphaerochaeta sp.]|nr:aminotransferase class V-fold PLP-dependent enzyme [Sphaerochaeta sp.]
MREIRYFDNAATTSMSRSALDAYTKAVVQYRGNPSSLHQEGRDAKAFLEQTRADLAGLLGVDPLSLTFTSGATESNAIILNSLIWKERKGQVILSGIEHPSVSEYARLLKQLGWKVTTLAAPNGFVQKEDLQKALSSETRLVCIMLVNNVVGTIQDVGGLVEVVRAFESEHNNRKIHVHTDATQALGKIRFDLQAMGIDSASFSAHKLHGPRGVGLLYNTNAGIESLSRGGLQERGLRPGTENIGGIA